MMKQVVVQCTWVLFIIGIFPYRSPPQIMNYIWHGGDISVEPNCEAIVAAEPGPNRKKVQGVLIGKTLVGKRTHRQP